jgi:hypothetical protein
MAALKSGSDLALSFVPKKQLFPSSAVLPNSWILIASSKTIKKRQKRASKQLQSENVERERERLSIKTVK